MRPCLAIDSDYLNIGIKPGMTKVPIHEILIIPTFAPSASFILIYFCCTHTQHVGIKKKIVSKFYLYPFENVSTNKFFNASFLKIPTFCFYVASSFLVFLLILLLLGLIA